MDKTRLESVVADALRLAKQMMRDSWSSGEVASWAPGYEALKSHLREEIAVCIERAIAAERERMEAKHKGLLAVQHLINESRGVTGLHLNGDEADWVELRGGGRFEEWLLAFDEALSL